MNKYEFMTIVLLGFALVAVGLAFVLRDDGRSRRIYVRHEKWPAELEPPEYRVGLTSGPGRAALPAAPRVIDATAVRTGQPRKELER